MLFPSINLFNYLALKIVQPWDKTSAPCPSMPFDIKSKNGFAHKIQPSNSIFPNRPNHLSPGTTPLRNGLSMAINLFATGQFLDKKSRTTIHILHRLLWQLISNHNIHCDVPHREKRGGDKIKISMAHNWCLLPP